VTHEQLDAIRARVDAATPGPWEPSSDTLTWIHVEAHGLTVAECRTYLNRQHTDEQNDANAAFIASAREDVPALLAEVERLRDAHAMVVQVSGELCEKCGWAMKFPGEKCRCELLAEVERLTAERDAALAKSNDLLYGYGGFIGPCAHGSDPWDRCDECGDKTAVEAAAETVEAQRQEIKRMKTDRDAAFQRGVAAMREAAASHFSVVAPYDYVAPRIRALPDPEDKS
jgi:DNA-binding transcriptional MerR regulator